MNNLYDSYIAIKYPMRDKTLMILLIQLYLSNNHEMSDSDVEKYLKQRFSKQKFCEFAKDQLMLFGTDHCISETHQDEHEEYVTKSYELFQKWFSQKDRR